jgi:cell division protein FtsB
MAEKKNPLKNAKVVVRQSPAALKVVLIVLILFSMAALIALRWVHTGILAETENLRQEASALEHANTELAEKTDKLGSVQSVKDIAREELGLVDPDTVIITPQS